VAEKLSGWEALILWALLAEGGKSYWNPLVRRKMISKDHAGDRDALARKLLITSEKRPGKGKGIWMEVTEEGWRRAGENLSVTLPTTQTASAILQAWLTRLQNFMERRDFVLAEILEPQSSLPKSDLRLQPTAPDHTAVRDRIRKAYFELTGGRFNTRVLLVDLRQRLIDIQRGTLDEALGQIHLEEGTTLSGLNNPQELTKAIADAGLILKGQPMYALWITK
jgi:hypothetical protein